MGTLECCVCQNDFDTETSLPVVGTCGHSVCCLCVPHLSNAKCPLCQSAQAFRQRIYNFQLIELIKSVKVRRLIDQAEWEDGERNTNELRAAISRLTSQLESKELTVKELEMKVDAISELSKGKDKANSKLQSARDKLKNQLSRSETLSRELKKKVDAVTKEIEDRDRVMNKLRRQIDETKETLQDAENRPAKNRSEDEANVTSCAEGMQRLQTGTLSSITTDLIVRARILLKNNEAAPSEWLSMAEDLELEMLFEAQWSTIDSGTKLNSEELIANLRARAEDETKLRIHSKELMRSIKCFNAVLVKYQEGTKKWQEVLSMTSQEKKERKEQLFYEMFDHFQALQFQERMDKLKQNSGDHVRPEFWNQQIETLKANYCRWYNVIEWILAMASFSVLSRRQDLAVGTLPPPLKMVPEITRLASVGSVSHHQLVNDGSSRLAFKVISVNTKEYKVEPKYGIIDGGTSIPFIVRREGGPPAVQGTKIAFLFTAVSDDSNDAQYAYSTRTPEGCIYHTFSS